MIVHFRLQAGDIRVVFPSSNGGYDFCFFIESSLVIRLVVIIIITFSLSNVNNSDREVSVFLNCSKENPIYSQKVQSTPLNI